MIELLFLVGIKFGPTVTTCLSCGTLYFNSKLDDIKNKKKNYI